jgi:hypothetical protein
MEGGRQQRTYRDIAVACSLRQDGGSDPGAVWSASDMGGGAVGTRRGERLSGRRTAVGTWPVGRLLILHARIWTSPPTATNQGAARGDTATDRWAPHVSVF